ncbi:MAG: cell division protein ZapB [Candidatus Parabeggiatoa sp.]|nr:cell division protein ZapB [Candidatus Parabeggiatoa sp.]
MKIAPMTIGIWVYFLCSGCVTAQFMANGSSYLDWKSSIAVTEEDVIDIDKYRLSNDEDTLKLCLYQVRDKNADNGQCDKPLIIKKKNFSMTFAGNLPTLEAKQICQNLSKTGKPFYLRQQQTQKAEYVVKCHETEPSSILSLKKLCQSQYSKLEKDKNKFCPSSTGNAELQLKQDNERLLEENKRLKLELDRCRLAEENKKLKRELAQAKARIKELERASKTPKNCEITKDANTITVAIKNELLRFVKVNSTYRMGMRKGINIALTEQQANNFHLRATQLSPHSEPIYPNIFKAVSKDKMRKPVAGFWIQEQTIAPQLYKEMIRDGSADQVSYEEAMQVIKTLNNWCKGKVQFQLPEEKQFVHLARLAYAPIREGLQPCGVVKERVALDSVKQLLGHQWQLTSSYCSAFDNQACSDNNTRIKKGGSTLSQYAAECMPEYRAESMPDIREPNTTFRLVLKVIK